MGRFDHHRDEHTALSRPPRCGNKSAGGSNGDGLQVERYRGLDYREDLFTYGQFQVKLSRGDTVGIILSVDDPNDKDVFALFEREKHRREKLSVNLSRQNDYLATLAFAADQFIVRRGDDLRSIIAGYHWFADWGRDTMIALPGLRDIISWYENGTRYNIHNVRKILLYSLIQ